MLRSGTGFCWLRGNELAEVRSVCIVTSVHPDFDARVWRHATGLAALGVEVHLICPWKVGEEEIRAGVCLHPFAPVERRIERLYSIPLRVLPKVFRLLKRVQIIHFHDIDLLPYMAFLGLVKPVVYDVHENYPEEMLVRPYKRLPSAVRPFLYHVVRLGQWILASMLRNVVLVVPSQREDFWGERLKITYLWNYADKRLAGGRLRNYRTRGNVVAFPGSQYRENGSFILLEVAAEVKKKVPDVLFRMTDRFHGVKSLREEFLARRDALGLHDSVMLVPNVPASQIMEELNLARVGVIPALPVPKTYRGMPNKLFEYMAAGIPVVSFDYPYPREVIVSAGCGSLVAPENIRDFAEKIVFFLENVDEAIEHGQRGSDSFEGKYNWESQMPKLIDYYRSITA